jgi:hypothetical protein
LAFDSPNGVHGSDEYAHQKVRKSRKMILSVEKTKPVPSNRDGLFVYAG